MPNKYRRTKKAGKARKAAEKKASLEQRIRDAFDAEVKALTKKRNKRQGT